MCDLTTIETAAAVDAYEAALASTAELGDAELVATVVAVHCYLDWELADLCGVETWTVAQWRRTGALDAAHRRTLAELVAVDSALVSLRVVGHVGLVPGRLERRVTPTATGIDLFAAGERAELVERLAAVR